MPEVYNFYDISTFLPLFQIFNFPTGGLASPVRAFANNFVNNYISIENNAL